MKSEVRAELLEKKIEKQAKLLREYRNLVKLSNSKDFFNIPSVNILESELSAIDKQIKEAENTPVESKNNVELFEKIEKLKRDITKKRKGWVFPNEGYIEATGMIMICDQILDWIKIESQELPAEVKPTASITDIMLFLEKNGIKQGYNIGVRDCARLIQEFIAQWSQPHSDIVKPSDQDIENASRDYINDDRFNGLLTTMKQIRSVFLKSR